jgi:hypothetical protein
MRLEREGVAGLVWPSEFTNQIVAYVGNIMFSWVGD